MTGFNVVFNYIPPELWEYIARKFLHTREDYRALKQSDAYLSSKFTEQTYKEFRENNTTRITCGETTAYFMFEYSAFFSKTNNYIYMKNGLIHRDDNLPALCIDDMSRTNMDDENRVNINKFYHDIIEIMKEDINLGAMLHSTLDNEYIDCLYSIGNSKIYMYYYDGDINIHAKPIGVCVDLSYIYYTDDNLLEQLNAWFDSYNSVVYYQLSKYGILEYKSELDGTYEYVLECEIKAKNMIDDIINREQLFSPTAYAEL